MITLFCTWDRKKRKWKPRAILNTESRFNRKLNKRFHNNVKMYLKLPDYFIIAGGRKWHKVCMYFHNIQHSLSIPQVR